MVVRLSDIRSGQASEKKSGVVRLKDIREKKEAVYHEENNLDTIRSSQREAQKSVGFVPKPNTQVMTYNDLHHAPEQLQSPAHNNVPKGAATVSAVERNKDKVSRNIPLIGQFMTDLDKVADSKAAKLVKKVGEVVYTPGATMANIGGATLGVIKAISKIAPNLLGNTAGRVAQTAIREAAVGAPLGVGQSLAQGNDDKEALKGGMYGAALGGGLGAAGSALVNGAKAVVNSSANKIAANAIEAVKKVGNEANPIKARRPQAAPKYEDVKSVVQSEPPWNVNQRASEDGLTDAEFLAAETKKIRETSWTDSSAPKAPVKSKPPISKEEFQKMTDSDEYFIRTVRTPEKDLAGRTSTPAGKIGIELGLSSDTHKGLSGFNLKDQKRMLEWMGKEGWEHENVAVYKGKPTKEQVTLDPGEVEFNPDELVGYIPTKSFKEHGGDFHAALVKNFPESPQVVGESKVKRLSQIREEAAAQESALKSEVKPVEPAQPFEKSKPSGSLLGDIKDAATAKPNSGISPFGNKVNEYDRSSLNSTKSQLSSKTKKEFMTPREAVETGYRKMVDDLYRFKDFDALAERTLGRKLKPSEQTHTLALNSRGTDMITRHNLTENMVDINGNVVGPSLKNASQQISKKNLIDFEDYQVLKHAMSRMERGEKVYRDNLNIDLDGVAQRVFDYETKHPEFKKINAEFIKYSENLANKWLVDTGVLKRETLDGYLENNPFYAPNMREFSRLEKGAGGGRARRGFSQGNPIKPAVGSQRKIISPIESRIEQTDQYVKVGKRNQVLQTVYKMAENDPEAFEGFLEILPMTDNMTQSGLKELNEIIAKDGIDGLIDNMNGKWDELFTKSKEAGKKDMDNVLGVMIDGEPKYVRIHDAPFLEGLTSLTPQAQGVILNVARQTTRFMKLLTTGANPVFSITRNLIRDIPMSYIASKTTNNPIKFAYDLVDSFVSVIGNKKLYNSFKSVGGGHSSPIAADRNLIGQSKRAVLPQRNRLTNIPGKIVGGLENFANALETAPRLGEYKRVTKAGGNTADSKIRGLFEANDVTVNFKRRGNVGNEIDAFVPYFNAAIQGLDKTIRTFKDRPVAAAVKALVGITIPTLITYALNYNNKDYKQLDSRTKDMFYLLPNGDGTFKKFPKPREGGAVFGSGVERILNKWLKDDPEAFKGFAETVRYSFTPPVASGLTAPNLSLPERLEGALVGDSILSPLADVRANKDFAGRPIVPGYMEGVSPKNQYDSRTSEISKKLGDIFNSSPKQLDYVIKSYTGIIGQLGIPINSEGGNLLKALKQQVTADPTYSNGISTEFYNIKNKVDTANEDFKQTGERSKDFNDPLRLFLNGVSEEFSKIRKAMRTIQSDKTLTGKQKETKTENLQKVMNAMGASAIARVKEVDGK